MRKNIFLILCLGVFFAVAGEEVQSVTNLLISSDTKEMKGWSRQHVMANKDNKPVNDQGKLVSFADTVAQLNLAYEVTKSMGVISQAMTNAIESLTAVTNLIPAKSLHLQVYLPQLQTPENLTGEVISETSDGITDTQTVRYSQKLKIPPNRAIEYVYNDVTARVSCVWKEPWDTNSLTHVCTIARPSMLRNKRALTYRHERFGGANGFDFGSALVTVDGIPTFTGIITNAVTLEEMEFRNGVLIERAKEILEE